MGYEKLPCIMVINNLTEWKHLARFQCIHGGDGAQWTQKGKVTWFNLQIAGLTYKEDNYLNGCFERKDIAQALQICQLPKGRGGVWQMLTELTKML